MKRFTTSVLLLLSVITSTGMASPMVVDRMIVYFEPNGARRQDVVVSNREDQPLYLDTVVKKVLSPGLKDEKQVPITDPAELKFLVAPKRSVIAPRGRKAVRLVNLETPSDREAVYRVTFSPVPGSQRLRPNTVAVVISYEVLVFVRPLQPQYKLVASRQGTTITLTNQGNSNVMLLNGQFCLGQKSQRQCTELEQGIRLYTGQNRTLELPGKNGEVEYWYFDGHKERRQIF
ncbi:MAG: fimbrial biogenesis chaperone [Endozoicomonas sp.]